MTWLSAADEKRWDLKPSGGKKKKKIHNFILFFFFYMIFYLPVSRYYNHFDGPSNSDPNTPAPHCRFCIIVERKLQHSGIQRAIPIYSAVSWFSATKFSSRTRSSFNVLLWHQSFKLNQYPARSSPSPLPSPSFHSPCNPRSSALLSASVWLGLPPPLRYTQRETGNWSTPVSATVIEVY